jgi:serine/threonine protein kinase
MIGQISGHYLIVEEIGAGGMSVVCRAHDEQLDRDVAFKVHPAGLLADEAARKRFRKKARPASRTSPRGTKSGRRLVRLGMISRFQRSLDAVTIHAQLTGSSAPKLGREYPIDFCFVSRLASK